MPRSPFPGHDSDPVTDLLELSQQFQLFLRYYKKVLKVCESCPGACAESEICNASDVSDIICLRMSCLTLLMTDMACSCCKKDGHNVRTCPKVKAEARKRGIDSETCDWSALADIARVIGFAIGAPC
jgi:hypothetical protein